MKGPADILERHSHHEALELVEGSGDEAIRAALTAEAWRNETLSAEPNGNGNPANANGQEKE